MDDRHQIDRADAGFQRVWRGRREATMAGALRPAAPVGETTRTSYARRRRKNRTPPLAPLGRRMKQRVARGKEAIDGRLDLHGLTQSEAHAALLRFLRTRKFARRAAGAGHHRQRCRARRRRTRRAERQVPQWLGLPEFRGAGDRLRGRACRARRRGRALRARAAKQTN